MVVIVTLQKDNATMIRIEGKDILMGFTMVLGKYLLHYVSYYSCNIVATSMNKISLTLLQYQRTNFFQPNERPNIQTNKKMQQCIMCKVKP
jgi:hypothetical protein